MQTYVNGKILPYKAIGESSKQIAGDALRKHVEPRVLIKKYVTADNRLAKDILGKALEYYPFN